MKIFSLFASISALTATATCSRVEIADWDYTNVVIGETYNIELVTDASALQVSLLLCASTKCRCDRRL